MKDTPQKQQQPTLKIWFVFVLSVCLFVCCGFFVVVVVFLQRLAEQTLIITYSHDMSHESETHREHNKISSTRAIRQFSEADGRGITELTGKSGKTTNSSQKMNVYLYDEQIFGSFKREKSNSQ